jgi:hypothetical protein
MRLILRLAYTCAALSWAALFIDIFIGLKTDYPSQVIRMLSGGASWQELTLLTLWIVTLWAVIAIGEHE